MRRQTSCSLKGGGRRCRGLPPPRTPCFLFLNVIITKRILLLSPLYLRRSLGLDTRNNFDIILFLVQGKGQGQNREVCCCNFVGRRQILLPPMVLTTFRILTFLYNFQNFLLFEEFFGSIETFLNATSKFSKIC